MLQPRVRTAITSPLVTLVAVIITGFALFAFGQDHPSMPPGMSHQEHMKQMRKDAEMKERGNAAMGFDQEKVVHHFHLTRTGGAIEVRVKQDTDADSRKQIRDHLENISREFADGLFTSPI